jgi:hypothetical protein
MTRTILVIAGVVLLAGCADRHFVSLGDGSAVPVSAVKQRAEEQAISDAEALRQLREEAQQSAEGDDEDSIPRAEDDRVTSRAMP